MAADTGVHLVLGAGLVGRVLVERFRAFDLPVRVVTRSGAARYRPWSRVSEAGLLTRGLGDASADVGSGRTGEP